ncbi:OmpA family protein [Salegentibacter maritimus]|uniref:OmpA family protein n=1 Tax=Salegentibacter maritimus TaxID=2794347 RepID=UPI0018E48423|nr:OmpA family protein [Salegentibacter maritimus]MBI6117650.1 OmpA family protein [Salegentibacter maritimus]
MIKNFQYLYIFFFLCSTSTVMAQEAKLDKANEAFNEYEYINARDIYLEVAEKGFESEELFQRLGDSYYFNAAYDDAVSWYERLFDFEEDQETSYLRRYAQALKATGNDEKAKHYYNLFKSKNGGAQSSSVELSAEDYLELIDKNSDRYRIKKLKKINSGGIEFGHFYQDGDLIYASTRDTGVFVKRKSAWDGLSFLNLYSVAIKKDSVLNKPKKLKRGISGKFHESSAVISKDGETMYFTKNNADAKNKSESKYLKIYRTRKKDGKWQEPEDLAINSDAFSTAHPALDSEEKYLYFSSNRPGGFGNSDLYRVAILKTGELGEPENLGAKINTEGKETFPFVSKNNELYFSSDGHFGLGGLDVFYIKIENPGFGDLLNVGEPINSYADDFSFGVDTQTKNGFFSSNRTNNGDFAYADIYFLKENSEIVNFYKATITGQVKEEGTMKPIPHATITLYKDDDSVYKLVKTDSEGNYSVVTNYFNSYRLRAQKENFDAREYTSEAKRESQKIDFQLKRNSLALVPGTDISKVLNIKHILFDFDKWNIRKDARVELEKLLAVMQKYPKLKIEIRSHTDSRGSDAYNKKLSERRAKSTMEYLIENNIDANRLKAKGYGEERLLNECKNGVNCSKEKHQENRRSEFIILE